MKGKITLFIYAILILLLVYARITDDDQIYLITKLVLLPVLILHYILNSQKINIAFLLILFLYFLGDIIFTQSSSYELFGFNAYLIGNIAISLLILNRAKIASSFYRILAIFTGVLMISTLFFYELEFIAKIILALFFTSIVAMFICAYYDYKESNNIASFWMLIGAMSLVFSSIFANINYFIVQNPYYSGFSSLIYGMFLISLTYSVLLEDKERSLKISQIVN